MATVKIIFLLAFLAFATAGIHGRELPREKNEQMKFYHHFPYHGPVFGGFRPGSGWIKPGFGGSPGGGGFSKGVGSSFNAGTGGDAGTGGVGSLKSSGGGSASGTGDGTVGNGIEGGPMPPSKLPFPGLN